VNPGKALEQEVYEELRRVFLEHSFFAKRGGWHVFLNKKYYSRDRQGIITVDVCAEYQLPGATEPSLVWVWECKDLKRPIEVGHVEKFHETLQQIGADNTKGTLVSRGPFTKSALAYAKSKRIGLARFLFPERLVHISRMGGNVGPTRADIVCARKNVKKIMCSVDFDGAAKAADWGICARDSNGWFFRSDDRLVVLAAAERIHDASSLRYWKTRLRITVEDSWRYSSWPSRWIELRRGIRRIRQFFKTPPD
jgi:Restriction endonuclease